MGTNILSKVNASTWNNERFQKPEHIRRRKTDSTHRWKQKMAVWAHPLEIRAYRGSTCYVCITYVKCAKLALWSWDVKKISRCRPKTELYGESGCKRQPKTSCHLLKPIHKRQVLQCVAPCLPLKHPWPTHASLTSHLCTGKLREVRTLLWSLAHKAMRLVISYSTQELYLILTLASSWFLMLKFSCEIIVTMDGVILLSRDIVETHMHFQPW